MGLLQNWVKDRQSLRDTKRFGDQWHRQNTVEPPSDRPLVHFAIPLISRARADDWDRVCSNLAVTLTSLRRQSHPDWRAVVCCQDQPGGVSFDDQVQFVPFDTADVVTQATRVKFDKVDKLHRIKRFIAETRTDGYLFNLDADDILHPKLVAHIVETNNGRGYYIDKGYMYDTHSGDLAPLVPGPFGQMGGKRAFYRECGSSSAFRIDFRRSDACLDLINNAGAHKRAPMNMAAMGFAMDPVPFPAAIYAVNHGQNVRQIRGKLGQKMQYLARHKMPAQDAARVLDQFGMPEIMASLGR